MLTQQQQQQQLQQRRVSIKFRCLMGALTILVVCVMTFNIFWLHTVLETQEKSVVSKSMGLSEMVLREVRAAEGCGRRRTAQDVQKCFPPRIVRQLGSTCDEIQDWNDVQRCLNGRLNKDVTEIRHVHIVGERHSGTKFLTKELQTCFPRKTRFTFRVHRDFIRSKHFFQPILDQDLASSIIIVVVRNPVDWVAAMNEKPYHSPFHVKGFNGTQVIPMDWNDFVSQPWTMPRLPGWEARTIESDDTVCQEYFRHHEVIPCEYNQSSGLIAESIYRGFSPLYELQRDGSGRPFSSIIDLRTEKLVNFVLEIPLLTNIGGFLVVRYEDILRKGTTFVLEKIQQMLKLPNEAMTRCRPTPPQPDLLKARQVDDEFRKYVLDHIDPKVEKLLDYV